MPPKRNIKTLLHDLGYPGDFKAEDNINDYWQAYGLSTNKDPKLTTDGKLAMVTKSELEQLATQWLGSGGRAEKYWPGGRDAGKPRAEKPDEREFTETAMKELFIKKWACWKSNAFRSKKLEKDNAGKAPRKRGAPKQSTTMASNLPTPRDESSPGSDGDNEDDEADLNGDGDERPTKKPRTDREELDDHLDSMFAGEDFKLAVEVSDEDDPVETLASSRGRQSTGETAASLKDQVSELQKEIAWHKNQVKEMKAQIVKQAIEIKEQKAGNAKQATEVKVQKAEIAIFANQMNEIETYKTDVEAFKADIKRYKSEIETYKTDVEAFKADIKRYKSEIEGYKGEIEVHRERITQLEEQNMALGGDPDTTSLHDRMVPFVDASAEDLDKDYI